MAHLIAELSPQTAHVIRIPGELDVPITSRVMTLCDTPAMQRLKRISQLGLVSHVYPGATHSRFEHSLGVYRLACQVLEQLLATEHEFASELTEEGAKVFLVAALLHDVGHWPYCHPVEDLRLDWVPKHEALARQLICSGELASVIETDWQINPSRVADFLVGAESPRGSYASPALAVLRNVLNGPIDIDKMDYLQRDSLHAGVPYGNNFDVGRLVKALCIAPDRQSLAITDKGKTAAEMMVFARYVMFSEVYWHHTVRSATAMLQRIVFGLADDCDTQHWLEQSDAEFASELLHRADSRPELKSLACALFGRQRQLYKRLSQYNFAENPAVHTALAGCTYETLVGIAEQLSDRLSSHCGVTLNPSDVLIDAPPVKLEVQFQLNVRTERGDKPYFEVLSKLSPVVHSLATEQFDSFVKRVRVFVAPQHAGRLRVSQAFIAEELLSIVAR